MPKPKSLPSRRRPLPRKLPRKPRKILRKPKKPPKRKRLRFLPSKRSTRLPPRRPRQRKRLPTRLLWRLLRSNIKPI